MKGSQWRWKQRVRCGSNEMGSVRRSDTAPGPLLLFGAPGAGKETQARELARLWGIPHISIGDLLRNHVNLGTSVGHRVKDLMARGELVPDSLVNEMVAGRTHQPDTARGCILDGYHRTLSQAYAFLQELRLQRRTLPLVALRITISESQLLRRGTGRRSCPACQRSYNVFLNPPKREGICDQDHAELIERTDDIEETFKERMRSYEKTTGPVIRLYRKSCHIADINGNRPMKEVLKDIVSVVMGFRSRQRTELLRSQSSHISGLGD